MSDFAPAWRLSRDRFDDAIFGLNNRQLNWRLHPGTLTAAEMAVHVAGVETWFIHQLTGCDLGDLDPRVLKCATEGVVNDNPYPILPSELTVVFVQLTLDRARSITESVIESPSSEVLEKSIVSALGPVIDGRGAFARLGFHAGYHLGQVHFLKTAPGFPG